MGCVVWASLLLLPTAFPPEYSGLVGWEILINEYLWPGNPVPLALSTTEVWLGDWSPSATGRYFCTLRALFAVPSVVLRPVPPRKTSLCAENASCHQLLTHASLGQLPAETDITAHPTHAKNVDHMGVHVSLMSALVRCRQPSPQCPVQQPRRGTGGLPVPLARARRARVGRSRASLARS